MNQHKDALRRVGADLIALGQRFAIVGGLACSVRGEPRLTRDIDVAVVVDNDQQAERLVFELQNLGYEIEFVIEQTSAKRMATTRLRLPPAMPTASVDLLFASCGIEPELVAQAELLEVVADVTVPVCRIGHLVALKLLARDDATRPQDRIDLLALRPKMSNEEWARARNAVELIESRGFARGKDLRRLLEDFQTGNISP